MKLLAEGISPQWVQTLFWEFIEHCGGEGRATSSLARARESYSGFIALGKAFAGPEDFTSDQVFEILTPDDDHKRNLGLRRFLEVRYNLKLSLSDLGHIRHKRFAERMLAGRPAWMVDVLRKFLDSLYLGREKRLGRRTASAGITKWKSFDLALRYGVYLLEHAAGDGCGSLAEIGQKHIDSFCAKHRKVFFGVSAFVRYLNESSHRLSRLKLPKGSRSSNTFKHHLGERRFLELLSSLLVTEEPVEAKNASIALLCMLHLRPLGAILSITRDQVQDDGEVMRVKFPRGPLNETINADVASVIRIWMRNWDSPSRAVTAENNPYLFPAMSPGKHLLPTAFQNWLKDRYGVTVQQILATGMHVMISRGMISPAALVEQYGWSHSTAIKYWTDSGQGQEQSFRFLSQRVRRNHMGAA